MLTKDEIEDIRKATNMYIGGLIINGKPCIDELCDMALAHAKAQEQEPVGYQGWHPRIGVVEFTPNKPAPSVMRDFKMRPVYAAAVPAKAQLDDPDLPQPLSERGVRHDDLGAIERRRNLEGTSTTSSILRLTGDKNG